MTDNVVSFGKPAQPEQPAGDPLARALMVQEAMLAHLLRHAAVLDALLVRVALLEQAVISAGAIATTALARCPEPVIQ